MPTIHPTAIVDPRAQLADDVVVHPYCIIGPDVQVKAGCIIHAHSILAGPAIIGVKCQIGPAAYVGLDPQHLHFLAQPDRPPTWLVIGDNTVIRETATLHRATKAGVENATRIGHDCLLMAGAHVAHDCVVGNHVVLANSVLMGGHCHIGERVFLGGGCALHQFCRVGRLAIVGGNEAVSRDVPPFGADKEGGLKGYNAVGCKRAGLSRDSIKAIRRAFQCLHSNRTMTGVVAAIRASVPLTSEVNEILEFITTTKRGLQPSAAFLHASGTGEEQ